LGRGEPPTSPDDHDLEPINACAFNAALGAQSTISAYELYTRPHRALPVGSFEEHIAKYARAIEAAKRRKPVPLTGETFPVGKGSLTVDMDRAHVEAVLQGACPMGVRYLHHFLHVSMANVRDFEAACAHFGLRGAIRDITREEVAEEVRARAERGDEPSTGYLPMSLDEQFPRDEADARIAIVARRIAEAKAREVPAAAPAAWAAAARARAAAGGHA